MENLDSVRKTSLPDTQNQADLRQLKIDRVGVKNVSYPIAVKDRENYIQHTIAKIEMTVDLPQEFKGTHMSRFVEILQCKDREIHIDSVDNILGEMQKRLHAANSHIILEFPYFRRKEAPVTKKASLLDYKVKFHAVRYEEKKDFVLTVTVPVTTLCPCSKNIAKYGAHNQRGEVTIAVRFKNTIWIEDIIDIAESSASCDLYSLLKREDEKFVTERAYENPVFVEDLVRNVVSKLKANPEVIWYKVEAENFESIHNHNAYAMIESHPELNIFV